MENKYLETNQILWDLFIEQFLKDKNVQLYANDIPKDLKPEDFDFIDCETSVALKLNYAIGSINPDVYALGKVAVYLKILGDL